MNDLIMACSFQMAHVYATKLTGTAADNWIRKWMKNKIDANSIEYFIEQKTKWIFRRLNPLRTFVAHHRCDASISWQKNRILDQPFSTLNANRSRDFNPKSTKFKTTTTTTESIDLWHLTQLEGLKSVDIH